MVNRAGLEPATRCCIQKCYVVGSSSISLRHTSRFCTVFGTVLFPNLFPDSQKCNELMLLAGVVTVVELSVWSLKRRWSELHGFCLRYTITMYIKEG